MKKIITVCLLLIALIPMMPAQGEQLTNGLDAYIDELLQEKGLPFRYWSIEDKAWLSERLPELVKMERAKEYGEISDAVMKMMEHKHGLPGESDIPKDEAFQIASKALKESKKLTDEEISSLFPLTWFYVDDPEHPIWVFSFYGQHSRMEESLQYSITIPARTGGYAFTYDKDNPAIEEKTEMEKAIERAEQHRDALMQAKGDERNWSLEEKVEMMELDLQAGMQTHFIYGFPEASELSEEEAVKIAFETIKEKYKLSNDGLNTFQVSTHFYISHPLEETSNPIWMFELYPQGKDSLDSYFISIDAKTGEAVKLLAPGEANG